MTDQEHLQRAADARALTENKLLTEAVEAWKKELMQAWIESPARDAEGREKLYMMTHAASSFQQYVLNLIDTGKIVSARAQGLYSTTSNIYPGTN